MHTGIHALSHMQTYAYVTLGWPGAHEHRQAAMGTHSHMRTCTHTRPGWSLRNSICLALLCFRPLAFWAHAHFITENNHLQPNSPQGLRASSFLLLPLYPLPILGPRAKSFYFKEKSLSLNWAASTGSPVWGLHFANLSLRYKDRTQSSHSLTFQKLAKWESSPPLLPPQKPVEWLLQNKADFLSAPEQRPCLTHLSAVPNTVPVTKQNPVKI